MRPSPNDIGIPAGEPKNGDFVAYLAQIEKRQLAALPARSAHAPPALSAAQPPRTETQETRPTRPALSAGEAERVRRPLKLESGQTKGVAVAAVMALFGVFFAVLGLAGDGGMIALLIGAFLLWRAWVSLRAALRGMSTAQYDRAARMVGALRPTQHRK